MLELKKVQVAALLGELNSPARVEEYWHLGEIRPEKSPSGSPTLKAAWEADQDQPYDTSYSPFRRLLVEWFDDLGRHVDPRHPLFECADAFWYSGPSQPPVAAFLALNQVFYWNFSEQAWLVRPWQGSREDPTMRLSYSRKYDHERAVRAENSWYQIWENLLRAADLLEAATARVYAQKITDPFEKFVWPDFDDIQAGLHAEGFGLGFDDIGAIFGGTLTLELLRVENTWHPGKPDQWKALYPPVAEASYQGPLTLNSHPSPATVKKLLWSALEKLQAEVWDLCTPEEVAEEDENQAKLAAYQEIAAEAGRGEYLEASAAAAVAAGVL